MKTERHYYILVFTDGGPVYVTKVDHTSKTSFWDCHQTPKEFSKSVAEDISYGLLLNGYLSVVAESPCEITSQPYRYDEFELKFERRETDGTGN